MIRVLTLACLYLLLPGETRETMLDIRRVWQVHPAYANRIL